MDKQEYKFEIDPEFKNLIPPLGVDEYRQLEQNILADGCQNALCIWHGLLLDGHNRFEICSKHNIPYQVRVLHLRSREDAIAWICKNQLGRRNLSEESRKYLIGKRYEAEKDAAGSHNLNGRNQHSPTEDGTKLLHHPQRKKTNSKTAYRLGTEYHISHTTVNKYGTYAKALDALAEKRANIVPKILAGQVKISHENIVELSTLPEPEVCQLCEQLESSPYGDVTYAEAREHLHGKVKHKANSAPPAHSIKSMPAYDPDSEISSLALTIPSWVSTIKRTEELANLRGASQSAKERLKVQLTGLMETASAMYQAIEEANHG